MVFNLVRLFSIKPGAFFQFQAIVGELANSIDPSVFVATSQVSIQALGTAIAKVRFGEGVGGGHP